MARMILGAALLLLAPLSIGVAGGGETPSPKSLYPLAVGNSWTFTGDILGQKQRMEVTITGRDGKWYLDNAGGRLMLDGSGLRDKKRYLIKSPLKAGATWLSVITITSTEHFEVIATGVKEIVKAGAFENCVRIRGRNKIDRASDFVTEWTYAPGVGMIRLDTFILKSDGKIVLQGRVELESYKIVK